MTATVAAVANLKGGVGKSTTTVMLADALAYFYALDVLIIDLDAQANSSQMMLTEQGVQAAFEQGKGCHHLLNQFTDGKPPAAGPFIMPSAVSLEELRACEARDKRKGWISALPSHPQLRMKELRLEEDWYSQAGTPTTLSHALATHFRQGFADLMPLYDVILLDCPPHLSPLSRAGLALADVFVTPTMADAVSTWGTKQFSDWITDNISPDLVEKHFIVISRFRNTPYARQVETELRDIYLKDRWIGPTIPESVQILNAMDRAAPDSYNTFKGKYGRMKGDIRRLGEQFIAFLSEHTGETWKRRRS